MALLGSNFLNWEFAHAAQNPIILENQQSGTMRWRPPEPPADWRPGQPLTLSPKPPELPNGDWGRVTLAGFASGTSINTGDTITFFITNNPQLAGAQTPNFSLEIFRLGYYGGTGGRSMYRVTGLSGTRQPPCYSQAPPPTNTGLIECHWSASFRLPIPASWVSGVYVAQVINSENYETYIPFVVRDDAAAADFLYQQSVLTYQAYNTFGDRSLYVCRTPDCPVNPKTGLRDNLARKVSFDRPYNPLGASTPFDGQGHPLDPRSNPWGAGQLFYKDFSEQKFIYWLEQAGYDVTYSTDIDTHANPARLLAFKGFLAVGHDEYWSREMYDAMQSARDQGVHLAFFGADDGYWHIRLEPSSQGVENRIVTCYRNYLVSGPPFDPVGDPAMLTIRWRDLGRPEQTLIGAQFGNGMDYGPGVNGDYHPGNGFPYVVAEPGHWAFDGTGVTRGTAIPDVLGQEWDTVYSAASADPNITPYPRPPFSIFESIAHSRLSYDPSKIPGHTTLYKNDPYTTDSVVYKATSGAIVFAAGTIIWGHAMDESPMIRRITWNVLNRFLATEPNHFNTQITGTVLTTMLALD